MSEQKEQNQEDIKLDEIKQEESLEGQAEETQNEMEVKTEKNEEQESAPQEVSVEYVGFMRRLGASVIDMFWSVGIVFIIAFVFIDNSLFTQLLMAALVVVLWVKFGATPGKQLLDMQIVDAETLGKPTTKQFIIRYLGYIVSTIVVFLGFLWVIWDKRKQSWHDKMAKTVVIHKPATKHVKQTALAVTVLLTFIGFVLFYSAVDKLLNYERETQVYKTACDTNHDAQACMKVVKLAAKSEDPNAPFDYILYMDKACKLDPSFSECTMLKMIQNTK
jgi:uncharacterized RDD family membrane protein YckC